MTQNPAELLHTYFLTDSQGERRPYTPRILLNALGECEDTITAWGRMGKSVAAYEAAIPRWSSSIGLSYNADLSLPTLGGTRPDDGDMGILQLLAAEMTTTSPKLEPAEIVEINGLVQQVLKLIKDDDTLPAELAMHLATLLIQVETCVTEYEIRGDFALRDAVERLIANVRLAGERSAEPARWQKLWEDHAKPVLLGLAVEAPAIGLAIAQLSIGGN